MSDSFHARLDAFVAGGNSLIGRPSSAENCKLSWIGSGHTLEFGEGSTLNGSSVTLRHDGASITIGRGAVVRGRIVCEGGGAIKIGAYTKFAKECKVLALESTSIIIGEKCLFADVAIRSSDAHSVLSLTDGHRSNMPRDVIIEDHVWLAEGARIYKGVTIGRDSIIAAQAVVFRSIPKNSIAVGNPAKVVRDGITWSGRRLARLGDPKLAQKRSSETWVLRVHGYIRTVARRIALYIRQA